MNKFVPGGGPPTATLTCPLLLLIGWSGCSSSMSPLHVVVTGTLTHAGRPVEQATVSFKPSNGQGGHYQSVTGADGSFEMRTHLGNGRYQRGILPGEYQVSVIKLDARQLDSTTQPPRNLLPAKLADFNTSGLRFTVNVDGPNHYDLRL